jgi:hypothetical protein
VATAYDNNMGHSETVKARRKRIKEQIKSLKSSLSSFRAAAKAV